VTNILKAEDAAQAITGGAPRGLNAHCDALKKV